MKQFNIADDDCHAVDDEDDCSDDNVDDDDCSEDNADWAEMEMGKAGYSWRRLLQQCRHTRLLHQCRHRAMCNVGTNDMPAQLAISDENKDIDQLRKEQCL